MLDVKIKGMIGQLSIDATFTTEPGTVTALFGRSGSGKTTIVNMISGLVRPHYGRISINDKVLFDSTHSIDKPPNKRGIGYVFQDNLLFPHLTVKGNLKYGQNLVPEAERYLKLGEVANLLGLENLLLRRPRTLSGGEKKRVALGRALLSNPCALLMDEPLTGLDVARKYEVLPFIEKICRQIRLPIIYVSHDIDEVIRLSDQIALIDKGRTISVGPTETVVNQTESRLVLGKNDPSTIISGTITDHDTVFGLVSLETKAGQIRIPDPALPPGATLKMRLNARDISIALSRPPDISVLNVFPGVIENIVRVDTSSVDLRVRVVAELSLEARITALACQKLNLDVGMPVFALIKSVSIVRF